MTGGPRRPAWPGYLEDFHRLRAGITEDTLATARADGIDPYRWLLEPVQGAGRLLDLACGSGPLLPLSLPATWIGVDRSTAELARARRRAGAAVLRADAQFLPLATASFPVAVCSMAMMLLQPLQVVLDELGRVLSPAGTATLLVPGTLPLTVRDLARYGRLMVALRHTRLDYPNDRPLRRIDAHARAAGFRIVDDRRRRFLLPIGDGEDGERFVRSLYLPGVAERRVRTATEVARRWAGSGIGVPLRRITLTWAGGAAAP